MSRLRSAAWTVVLGVIARLPQAALSRLIGRLADVRLPRPLRGPTLRLFAAAVGADPAEAERPIDEYASINAFFVRRLRPGARSWPPESDAIACPVDGVLGQLGRIEAGTLVQAKGRTYTAARLLADDAAAAPFDGGTFLTLYLSPRHYHRIHAPVSGRAAWARHVPGRLLPVNAPSLDRFPELFPRNERVAMELISDAGRVAIVAIGAYNVGRISVAFDPEWGNAGPHGWVTNRRGATSAVRVYAVPPIIERGVEIMAFHLGSSVVLLFEPGRVTLRGDLEPGREVRLGERLATRA